MPSQAHVWAASSHNPWWAGIESSFCWENQTIWTIRDGDERKSSINSKVLDLLWCQDLGIGEGSTPSGNWAAKFSQEAAGLQVKP